jgi:death-on-curing protein
MIKYLSIEEILRLHFQVIEDYGGSHGVRDEGRIHSITNAPKQIVFKVEQYPDLITKAAVYLRNMISDHPFIDGNKRTAITSCGVFLQRNGGRLNANPKELEDFVVSIATEHLEIAPIAVWLKSYTSK